MAPPPPDTDVTAATDVLAQRPLGKDGRARVDWQRADLRDMRLRSRFAPNTADLPDQRYLPFSFADLSNADLRRSAFEGVDLHGALCSGANMAFTYFSNVNLQDVIMNAVDLSHATLNEANLRGADLENAILVNTKLTRADLSHANLRNADLEEANLSGANLHLADLTGADLTGVDLTGANLDQARGVPAALLKR